MIDGRIVIAVAVGAGLGGVLRLLVTQFIVNRFGAASGFYATLFINVSGSFAIGIVLTVAQLRLHLSPLWRYFFATGILGGYTTFSAFSYEALTMFSGALTETAFVYIIGSVGLGIIGTFLGVVAGRAITQP